MQVYWLAGLKQDKVTKRWSPTVGTLIRRAKRAGMDGIDLGRMQSVDKAFVDKVKKAGLQFYCWTINDLAEARRLQSIGIDGITTDRPGWMRQQLTESSR